MDDAALASAGFYFDEREAQAAVDFFSRFLVHVRGEWKGQPLELDLWQREEIIRPLFGWRRKDGTRRYRTAYIEVPRKNGKSTLCAGIALYLLLADGEPGPEIYSAASDKEQARIVFGAAKEMVEASPALASKVRVLRDRIESKRGGFYKVLSSEAYTKDGLNTHGLIVDELHAQPDDELVNVLRTSMGARRQPISIYITTAGFDRHSLCWREHVYAERVIKGEVQDPSHLALIYGASPEEDWTSPRVWSKANPGYGVSVKQDYLTQECAKAREDPAYENTFRRLFLDQWTEQASRWIQMHRWDQCGGEVREEELLGKPCWGGLDLASRTDIAALVWAFEVAGRVIWLPRFWIPEDGARARSKRDRVPYLEWAKAGLVRMTQGEVIDYEVIEADVLYDCRRFSVRELACDMYEAEYMTQRLGKTGLNLLKFGQGFASMSGASKNFLGHVLSRKLQHGDNPVLRWMASNAIVEQDAAGNIKPSKGKSSEKIDGIVAGIMATDRLSRGGGADEPSIYETRGL